MSKDYDCPIDEETLYLNLIVFVQKRSGLYYNLRKVYEPLAKPLT